MKCPACDTWVEEDAAYCWLCNAPIGAGAGAAPPPQPPIDLSLFAPPQRRGRALGTAILVIAIAIVLGGAGFGVWWLTRETGEGAVDDFLAGDGVEFTSQEGGFRARYPTEPRRVAEDYGEEGFEVTLESAVSRPGTDYLFSVGWYDGLGAVPGLFNALPQFIATEIEGDLEQIHARQVESVDAIEALVETDDQTAWGLIFAVDDRLYVIEVDMRKGERAPFDRFVESFELLDAED